MHKNIPFQGTKFKNFSWWWAQPPPQTSAFVGRGNPTCFGAYGASILVPSALGPRC